MAAAATTLDRGKITVGLKTLAAMMDDLSQNEVLWPQMGEGELVSWSMDWTQIMSSHVPLIERHYRAGTLQPGERRQYLKLRKRLLQLRPEIDRLLLTAPPFDS